MWWFLHGPIMWQTDYVALTRIFNGRSELENINKKNKKNPE